MDKINFKRAFYLKLGKQGVWEDELKKSDKARIGWSNIKTLDIQEKNWEKIRNLIDIDFQTREKKTGATQDYNALKTFCEATENDIFITFYKGKLYWCILDNLGLQEDELSKFRTTKISWNCTNIKGETLYTNKISGRISKTQGFRATLCKIEEKDSLYRIINAETNPIIEQIIQKKNELASHLEKAFKELHWSDHEVLADLIFRQSGWRRISLIGEKMKYIDIELEDPITKDLFQAQVKASAGKSTFEEYAEEYTGKGYNKLFFVTFNPEISLLKYENNYDKVQLLVGKDLAELVIDLGLTNWVLDKLS